MNSRERMSFPGGEAEVRTPKPDELLLSAQQWVTRAREELVECDAWAERHVLAACSALEHATRILGELKGHV